MIKNERERYWLAGILEGEGCFRMSRSTNYKRNLTYQYPEVSVQMNDLDVVQRVQQMIAPDNTIARRGRRKNSSESYVLKIANELAIDVMLAVIDLMGKRRQEKIEEVLAMPVGRVHA